MIAASILVCLIGAPSLARADEKEKPWSEGVSKVRQTRATELFKKGNDLFSANDYTDALEQYEKALKQWDNPIIEFNAATCLTMMHRPLDAWEHIEKALKYKEAPFSDPNTYKEALRTEATLDATLAVLEVSTEQEDVLVTLDGTELFTGPHKKKLHLNPGTHSLVATAEGFETDTRSLELPAGKATRETVELEKRKVKKVTIVKTNNYDRRWAWWVPWSVAAGSVALGLIGTAFYLPARSDMNTYDATLKKDFSTGVKQENIPPSLVEQELHAERLGQIGIGVWVGAGAVAVAAGVMAILNRPHLNETKSEKSSPDKPPEDIGKPEVSVIAVPNYVGVGVTLTFR